MTLSFQRVVSSSLGLACVRILVAYCARLCLVAFQRHVWMGRLLPQADYSLCETKFPQICSGSVLKKSKAMPSSIVNV